MTFAALSVGGLLRLSVAVAVATMALKALAWWLTGSVGLLSDAMESVVNLAGASFALAMVSIAARPADEDHPYGHHKAEYFASGFEGMLIFVAALAILWAAGHRLLAPQPVASIGIGLGLSLATGVLNASVAWLMQRKAREVRSMALEADARHLYTDVWTTAGVVVGLVAVHATGLLWLDPVIAIAVALNILREGFALVRRSVGGLMDESLEPAVLEQVQRTLAEFKQPGVRFDHVHSRRAGQRLFVDLHLHLPAGWSLGRAAAVRASVEQALMNAVPGLRATIQLLPTDVETRATDEEDRL